MASISTSWNLLEGTMICMHEVSRSVARSTYLDKEPLEHWIHSIHSNSKWTIERGVIYDVRSSDGRGRGALREPYFAVLFVWFGWNKKELMDGCC